jgi:hypothetical protein
MSEKNYLNQQIQALATVNISQDLTPALSTVFANSLRLNPVVITSSTSNTF